MLREQFREKLAERQAHAEALKLLQDAIASEYEHAILTEAKQQFPKRRNLTFAKARTLLGPKADEIQGTFKPRVDEIFDVWAGRRDALDEELRLLAQNTQVQPGGWHCYSTYSGSSYSSQGFGANHYAENAAKLRMIDIQAMGIEAEVRETERRHSQSTFWFDTRIWITYGLFVKVLEPLDVELLKRQEGKLSLRDWVKACWKIGSNPRVFLPGLPFDFEAKCGLDHFGNELPR